MSPLAFFAVLGFILTATPWVASIGAAVIVALHVWHGCSLWWLALPAVPLAVWIWVRFLAK